MKTSVAAGSLGVLLSFFSWAGALSARADTPPPACEGAEALARACDAGEGAACSQGGLDAPSEAARGFFQRACALGDGEGCARHALLVLVGEGGARDAVAGLQGLREACERTPERACALGAAALAEDARRRSTPREFELEALFAQQGCHAGDARACRLFGDVFLRGQALSEDSGKAFSLYTRECDAEIGRAHV